MKIKEINIVKDFHSRPYGRYNKDCPECNETSGEAFRDNILFPAMKDDSYDRVVVDLTGFNRYGRSFLDEAFGGLIHNKNLSKLELDNKLVYKHNDLKSIISIIDERIQSAENKRDK